jgi:sulfatase maturation enzyme AslB (radical SAM superfamily)
MKDYLGNKEISYLKLSITRQCNLRCRHCFVDKRGQHMEMTVAKKSINLLLSSAGKIKVLIIYGGEPLLHPNLADIIAYAKKKALEKNKKILVAVPTNGTLLDKNTLRVFKKHNVKLSISLDGGKSVHNQNKKFENGQGTFDIIAKNIPVAIKMMGKDNVSALMTVDPKFSHKLYDNFISVLGMGFSNVHIDVVHGIKWNKRQIQEISTQFKKITKYVIWEIAKKNFIYLRPLFSPFNLGILKEGGRISKCPFYCDLEIYPGGEVAFSQFLINLPNKKERQKYIVGDMRSGRVSKKFERCSFSDDVTCSNCWTGYYQGIRDPKRDGQEAIMAVKGGMDAMARDIMREAGENKLFKKYISLARSVIRGNLD